MKRRNSIDGAYRAGCFCVGDTVPQKGRPAVLVTGGAGFIGSHICKSLSKAGYWPVTYDNLSNGVVDAVRWGPLEIADLREEGRLQGVMARYRPIAVLHLAAEIEVGASVHDPIRFYGTNVAGTLSLLRAMRAASIDRIVFSSTAAVYGEPVILPIPEIHPLRPMNPYGRGKLMVEEILRDAAAAYSLRYCVLRYFNAAGADPDGELGENHDPETHLIPLAINSMVGCDRQEIVIYGGDYDTADGSSIRDYVHVSDLADAHVMALNRLIGSEANIVANIGSGRGYSVLEVIDAVERVVGKTAARRLSGRRHGDPACLVADTGVANQELDWEPSTLDLDKLIEDTVRWIARYQ